MYSTDPTLGLKVHQLLEENSLENPNTFTVALSSKQSQLQLAITNLLQIIGLDLNHPSIKETPHRITKFYINELFAGLTYANFPKITLTPNEYNYHNPVFLNNINFHSICEHHFVSIIGVAHIAYIPKQHVVGLSKIGRIVDFFSKRPQVQERLTQQIFVTLKHVLATEDVAVLITAKHNCMAIRGVEDHDVLTTTEQFGGEFLNTPKLQQQFLEQSK